jgi:hypothetical protein
VLNALLFLLLQNLVCTIHLVEAMAIGLYVRACVFILVPAFFCETAVYCASIPSSSQSAQSKPKGFGTAKRAVIIGRSLMSLVLYCNQSFVPAISCVQLSDCIVY